MADVHYLAIDQGGQSSRALILGRDGRLVAEGRAAVATQRPRDGWVEHDAAELARSVRSAIDQAWEAAGRCRIAAAGLATQRSTIVCWNRPSGLPLSPAISWQDRRNSALIEQLSGASQRVRALTGLPLSAHYGASKLAWCLAQLPAVRLADSENRLVGAPLSSFLLNALLAEQPLLVDPANAARTLLWSLDAQDWSAELLALFGIGAGTLPQCVPSEHAFGELPLGSQRVPLRVCTGDQSVVPFAAGPLDADCAYVNIGTGAFVQRPTGAHRPDAGPLLAGILHVRGSEPIYCIEATVNGAGSALQVFETLPSERADGADELLFINGVSGLGSPYWHAQLRSRFIGDGDRQARRRAVLDSVVFLIVVNLEEIIRRSGPLRRIVVTGGLAADDGLCSTLATLSGLPVDRPELTEATALGLGALIAGRPDDWQRPAGVRFEPADREPIAARYARWQAAMQAALEHG